MLDLGKGSGEADRIKHRLLHISSSPSIYLPIRSGLIQPHGKTGLFMHVYMSTERDSAYTIQTKKYMLGAKQKARD